MASICLYFQMHQPTRLRSYSVFDTEPSYFDDYKNAEYLRKIAGNCYLPTTELLLDLLHKLDGRFSLSLSITGVLIEQLREHCPKVIDQLAKLADTGLVEFLGETYYHSLAFLYSRDEFSDQLDLHSQTIENMFGQTPKVFRNTELIYSNDLAYFVASLGKYHGMLAEGVDHVLNGRTPNFCYTPPHTDNIKLLLKHYRLSDDIAFRFSNRNWSQWPLSVNKFASWIAELNGKADLCNLFMDIETFGEHQWAETGIFDFLSALPAKLLEAGSNEFLTISDAMQRYDAVDEYDVPHITSWADTERDLSAWLGNAMQSNALHELYKLERPVKSSGDEAILADWRKLTTSDHFYYMSTKYMADGDVHKYFNPYESPYDGYINFMNVLDNLHKRVSD